MAEITDLNLERYQKIFRASPLPISITSLKDGKILEANDALLKYFGYRASEVIGKSTLELGIWANPAEREEMIRLLRRDRSLRGMEIHLRAKGGLPKDVLISAELMIIDGQDCTLAVLTDITETKRLQAQFFQAQKMEAVGRLAAGVAHDFNNMLSVILGYGSILLEGSSLGSKTAEGLKEIVHAAERASALTRQLLMFSRRQASEARIADLNDCVRGVEPLLQRATGTGIQLVFKLAGSLPGVKLAPVHLEQAILNLVINARDAMPEGGKITIETSQVAVPKSAGRTVSSAALLCVRDTGHGIPEEIRPRIFEPFFTTKPVGKGTGLGLPAVLGMVEEAGGWLDVESEPGKGAAFKLHFPALGGAAEPREEHSIPLPPGGETILLAEDDDELRLILKLTLERSGYRVLEAESGEAALQLAKATQDAIHVLLTDHAMAGCSGTELAERLVRQRPGLRVIVMSGSTDEPLADQTEARRMHFLEKPFSPDTLTRKIRSVLDPGRT